MNKILWLAVRLLFEAEESTIRLDLASCLSELNLDIILHAAEGVSAKYKPWNSDYRVTR